MAIWSVSSKNRLSKLKLPPFCFEVVLYFQDQNIVLEDQECHQITAILSNFVPTILTLFDLWQILTMSKTYFYYCPHHWYSSCTINKPLNHHWSTITKMKPFEIDFVEAQIVLRSAEFPNWKCKMCIKILGS